MRLYFLKFNLLILSSMLFFQSLLQSYRSRFWCTMLNPLGELPSASMNKVWVVIILCGMTLSVVFKRVIFSFQCSTQVNKSVTSVVSVQMASMGREYQKTGHTHMQHCVVESPFWWQRTHFCVIWTSGHESYRLNEA